MKQFKNDKAILNNEVFYNLYLNYIKYFFDKLKKLIFEICKNINLVISNNDTI